MKNSKMPYKKKTYNPSDPTDAVTLAYGELQLKYNNLNSQLLKQEKEHESQISSIKVSFEQEISQLKEQITSTNTKNLQYAKLYQTSEATLSKISKQLKDSLDREKELQVKISELNINHTKKYNSLSKAKREAEVKLEEIQNNNKKLKNESESYHEMVKEYQSKIQMVKDKYLEKKRAELEGPDAAYRHLLDYVINKLETLLICPIKVNRMINPCILPSGNTVNEGVAVNLIRGCMSDPFDRAKICKQLIVNRFAHSVLDTMDKIEVEKSRLLEAKKQ
jgi:myosin heavy subunit